MRTFLQNTLITSIQRLSYNGTNGTWDEINANVRCYFRPLSAEQAAVNNFQWGRAHTILVQDSIDVAEGDKIIIDGDTYNVRGVVRHNRGREPYKKAVVTLPESP